MQSKTLRAISEKPSSRLQESGVRQVGFDAHLPHVPLPDLVQMECLAGSQRSLRVISDGKSGYLVFSSGQIVNAMTRRLRGEAAALEILSWQHGTVEPCPIRASEQHTITKRWQELLLCAAQRADEQRAERPSVTHDLDDTEFLESEEPEKAATSERVRRNVIRALRLDARGETVVARGEGDQEEFAGLSAYTVRLLQLLGEHLGVGAFRAVEWTLPDRSGLVYTEEGGGLAAIEALPQADLSAMRRKVGL